MADHYRVLGVTKNATKEQIKEAFRKLAIQFHPDKHAQSTKSAMDAATVKFKQASEAYEVLIDDRKRAAYNLSRRSYNNGGNFYSAGGGGGGYGYGYSNANYSSSYGYRGGGSYYKHSYRASSSSSRWASNLDAAFRYMGTREFLRSVIFAGILLVGTVAVDMSGNSLWKMHNTGKSFEETMESIHNKKTQRDKE